MSPYEDLLKLVHDKLLPHIQLFTDIQERGFRGKNNMQGELSKVSPFRVLDTEVSRRIPKLYIGQRRVI
jgi:hypothetical protein